MSSRHEALLGIAALHLYFGMVGVAMNLFCIGLWMVGNALD
jgi:hypothetical protein